MRVAGGKKGKFALNLEKEDFIFGGGFLGFIFPQKVYFIVSQILL